jgi:hypothetical protein
MKLQFKADGCSGYTALTTARVYQIAFSCDSTTQARLRVRPRAVLAGVPVADQWRDLGVHKNPAVAANWAQHHEDEAEDAATAARNLRAPGGSR